MNAALGLAIVVGLVLAFIFARRAANARIKREQQRRRRRKQIARQSGPASARSEMRAYEDPETLAQDISTRGRGPKEESKT